MHKTDLIKRVAREARLPQHIVADVIAVQNRLIEQTLRDGKTVSLPGFGTFYTSELPGGAVKNIRTGARVEYSPRRVARFRPGEILKRSVRGENRLGRSARKKSQ